jgi:hypothetical protein
MSEGLKGVVGCLDSFAGVGEGHLGACTDDIASSRVWSQRRRGSVLTVNGECSSILCVYMLSVDDSMLNEE